MDKLHAELAAKHGAVQIELDEARAYAGKLSNDSTAAILELEGRIRSLEWDERNASEGQRYAEARVAGLKRELDAARSSSAGSSSSAEKVRSLEAAVEEYKTALDALQTEARDVEARIALGAGLVKASELEDAQARVAQLEHGKMPS